jgi:hypothetical protein
MKSFALALTLLLPLAASTARAQVLLELDPPQLQLSDDELRAETLAYRLERGFGFAGLAIGGVGVIAGALGTHFAQPWTGCSSLLGFGGGCSTSPGSPEWRVGGPILIAAGAVVAIVGIALAIAGTIRRDRVLRERERRGLARPFDAALVSW